MSAREVMQYDVVVVGAGASGLSAAIRIRQKAIESGHDWSVCVLEKGSEVGAHILSGACVEPRALEELFPDWREKGAPLETEVRNDQFLFLTERRSLRLPMPPQMHNQGNYLISLGKLCRWLAQQAESLGVEIYPGFAATEVLYHSDGSVKGVATGDMGIGRDLQPTDNYQLGIELHARQTIFAEGCRGSLTKSLFEKFGLREGVDPQTYGLGIKEMWEVSSPEYSPGKVVHTVGWPLDIRTYGGSFVYHLNGNRVAIGFVVGLDYRNPWMSPYEEFQKFKTHPEIRNLLKNGRRIAYGARAVSEGGLQSLPKLTFPGGVLVGDAAGFLNVPKIKGTHTAMKSGIEAGEAVHAGLLGANTEVTGYLERLKSSWLWDELFCARNIRPGFRYGMVVGMAMAAVDTWLFRGKAPWTLRNRHDHEALKLAQVCKPIEYPKPDNKLTFNRIDSVALSNTSHEANQPCHLQLMDKAAPIRVNLEQFASPETRYCPAGVYEIDQSFGRSPSLIINAQNCLHCKTCDIKDPGQNINWTPPEGGGGPAYTEM